MITTEHGHIRAAEPDDAPALAMLYDPERPRSVLLDLRREPVNPTEDEVREMLGRKEMQQFPWYAVEDSTGVVRGFCSVRGVNQESGYGEIALLFHEDAAYETPLAADAVAFLFDRAYARLRLNKIVAHGLDSETALCACFRKSGFLHCGTQREVLYSLGRWHNLETFARFAE